jgi:RNA polymerase sigma-70 factor (ECF subfamily)
MTAGDRGPEPAGQFAPPDTRAAPACGSLVQVRAEWTGFYDANYHRVVRFMMHAGASLADAQDAAQEAFTESWNLMSRDPAAWQAIAAKEPWIRAVALRRHARPPGTRRRPLTSDAPVPDQPIPGPGHAELTAQAHAVLHALRSLDPEARAVMAFHLDSFTTADTATALGITPQRTRDVMKKARAALKRQLIRTTATEGRQP